MDKKTMKANLFLNVILPHIETLMEMDPGLKNLVRGWNCTIQFDVQGGGPAGYMEFTDGILEVKPGRHGDPTVLFAFENTAALVDMIDGVSKPMPKKGLFHLIILLKFMKLTTALEKTLQPEASALSDPENMRRTLTLLLHTVTNGMAYIAASDDSVSATVDHLEDGTAQIRVLPDGPSAYVECKDKKIHPCSGDLADPTVTMEIKSPDVAYRMFTGDLDTMAAIGAGDIVLTGLIPLFGDLSYIMGKIDKYMN